MSADDRYGSRANAPRSVETGCNATSADHEARIKLFARHTRVNSLAPVGFSLIPVMILAEVVRRQQGKVSSN